jgi:ribosomal protein L29
MKKTDKISYRQKSEVELLKLLTDLKKKLVETKAKHLSGNQKDTSVFRKIKHEIAFILTILKENGK